jgi:hypothetical protein
MSDPAPPDLFALGAHYYELFTRELAAYGVPAEPKMEIRRGKGMLCYYDTADGHIYLSVPDLTTPMGRLNLMVLRAYLGAKTEDEVLRFFGLFIPRLIGHELGHHLRHKHGRFGSNYWEEEQLANKLAVALTRHRLTPEERTFARDFLKRALAGLAEKVGIKDAAMLSYYNILEALNADGKIGDSALEQMQVAQNLFALKPEDVMPSLPQVAEARAGIIAEINAEYATDYVKYLYFHAGWLYVDLTNHTAEYVEDFAREHLGEGVTLLPAIEEQGVPSDGPIAACFAASRWLKKRSEPAARYFYKRYRMLLWQRLQASEMASATSAPRMRETQFFVESWNEGESDALSYLAQLAPPALRELFPGRIRERTFIEEVVLASLPTDTDLRLYRHVAHGRADEAAEATLYRLSLLERTDVFQPVPAESMLELARRLCRIHLGAGETIIWEGEVNDDVFFLTQGRLEVLVKEDGEEKRVGTIAPGEVFGEMAFFSRDVRGATARATEPSECFVIKDSDLLVLVFKHPSILMQMAGALTRRLARLNQHAAQGDEPVLSTRG